MMDVKEIIKTYLKANGFVIVAIRVLAWATSLSESDIGTIEAVIEDESLKLAGIPKDCGGFGDKQEGMVVDGGM